jgi:hypothetical protein
MLTTAGGCAKMHIVGFHPVDVERFPGRLKFKGRDLSAVSSWF